MQEEWYVELGGEPSGPHERQAVIHMRDTGRIGEAALVWREGFVDWRPYSDAGLVEQALPPRLLPASPCQPGQIKRTEPTVPDTESMPAFDLPSGEAPLTEAERHHENTMRRAMAQRNAARGHVDLVEGSPVGAPRLEVEDDGWQWIGPSPWRRYLARSLDTAILGWFTWMVLGTVIATVSKPLFGMLFTHAGLMSMEVLAVVLVSASLIPVNALLVGMSGMTPGKWIFGVRITRRDGSAIGFGAALVREASVFCIGIAGGVPLLAFISSFAAHQVLTRTGSTQWDRGKDWVVTQRELGDVQTAMFMLGLMALLVVMSLVRHVELVHR